MTQFAGRHSQIDRCNLTKILQLHVNYYLEIRRCLAETWICNNLSLLSFCRLVALPAAVGINRMVRRENEAGGD